MDIKVSNNNKFDPRVKEVQYKLNTINGVNNLNWTTLTPDGIYGKKTATVIKQFVSWNLQVSLTFDGMGLPVLSDALIRQVDRAYRNLPVMCAAPKILKNAAPTATPADPKAYQQMLDAQPSYPGRTTILPGWLTTYIIDPTKDLIIGVVSELKLLRDLRTKSPNDVIKWYTVRINPKMEAIKTSFQKWQALAAEETVYANGVQHMHQERALKGVHTRKVNEALPVGKRFETWLSKYDFQKKVDNFMKTKAGSIAKGLAKPVKWIWILKDVIGDLCILAYLLLTGQPIDNVWWSRFETNLAALADALIGGLLAELVVLGLVAAGVLAGPATIVAAIVGIVVAIIFGLLCDHFDFSPAKFFANLIAKAIVNLFSKIEPTITRGCELYAIAMQGNHAIK